MYSEKIYSETLYILDFSDFRLLILIFECDVLIVDVSG